MSVKDLARAAASAPKQATIGYWRGLKYPFRGMRFVFVEHGSLFRYWIFPILITLLSFVAVCSAAWNFSDDIANWATEPPSDSDEWWFVGLRSCLGCLSGCVIVVAGAFLVMLLSTIFAAPFNSALSEEVERLATGKPSEPFNWAHEAKDLLRTILLEITKGTIYLSITIAVWLLGWFLPGIGQVLSFIFSVFFTTTYLALDYIDWPASRRDRGIRHRFGVIKKNFLPMFGFGSGCWLFLFVPFVNLLFMPAAVAGGTLLYLDLEREGKL